MGIATQNVFVGVLEFCYFFIVNTFHFLGIKELSPPPLNLKRLYKETLEIEPILIIISPGADPSQELQELASTERNGECYHQVNHCHVSVQGKCSQFFFPRV